MVDREQACCEDSDREHEHGESDESALKREVGLLIGIALALALGMLFQESLHQTPYQIGEYALFLLLYLASGWGVLSVAGRNIRRGQVFDENFLMAVATLAAIAIHELPEAVGVMLFYRLGELLQDRAVGGSRRSVESLLAVRPDVARVERDGQLQTVAPEAVAVGERIQLKPGERIPLDGEVLAGSTQIDTSALTGESRPQAVEAGGSVWAGTINQTGALTVRVTRPFAHSSIAKVLDLVERAREQKAPTERFMTQFARIYTPIVVGLSLLVALLPPLVVPGASASEWTYRALVLLVIACPCGLVVSIPVGYFGGVGRAARDGILVKGSAFLDRLAQLKTVAFDKTGTLTQGTFQVTQAIPSNGYSDRELLAVAAQAEAHSNHPIAQSIQAAYGDAIEAAETDSYEEIAGCGIRARIGDRRVLAGNDRLLHREQIPHDTCNVGGGTTHVAVDGHYAGYLTIADAIKPDAAEAVRALKALGVRRTVMLTGDNDAVAAAIARQLGLDSYQTELLPEDKVTAIERLLRAARPGERVAYLGDGINDAPVIARADVGLAMGGWGSDAAIDNADVVLMGDRPSQLAQGMRIARATRRIVLQNIGLALGVKGVMLVLGAIGLASMWAAVFADMGVAVLVIANATRILR